MKNKKELSLKQEFAALDGSGVVHDFLLNRTLKGLQDGSFTTIDRAFAGVIEELIGENVEVSYLNPDAYPLDINAGEDMHAERYRDRLASKFGNYSSTFEEVRLHVAGISKRMASAPEKVKSRISGICLSNP